MKRFKVACLLSTAITIVAFISCKKDKHGNGVLAEKKFMVSTVAGDGVDGFVNGAALSARFDAPVDVAISGDGSIYVADYNNHRIRKISAGQVSTFAGSGTYGIVNGNGQSAQFKDPYRVATDGGGNIYMLDQVDPRIRKISSAADVTTYAGTDLAGFQNGAALQAQFQVNAEGIAADAQGNVYMGDTFNERIRKISTAGQVSTHAGNGTEGSTDGDLATAQFRFPDGVAIDGQGNIYVADGGNLCIRKVTPAGVVSRFAGNGTRGTADGNATDAQFYAPIDIVADSHGNLFVIDDNRIRKITPQGVVSTIAGSTAGYADGEGSTAKFKSPLGLGIDAQDNIYVADANNNRIRKISFQ
jgi:hypothetical protein